MPIPMPPKNKKEFSWGRFSKTLSFWILILLIPVILIQLTGAQDGGVEDDQLHRVSRRAGAQQHREDHDYRRQGR